MTKLKQIFVGRRYTCKRKVWADELKERGGWFELVDINRGKETIYHVRFADGSKDRFLEGCPVHQEIAPYEQLDLGEPKPDIKSFIEKAAEGRATRDTNLKPELEETEIDPFKEVTVLRTKPEMKVDNIEHCPEGGYIKANVSFNPAPIQSQMKTNFEYTGYTGYHDYTSRTEAPRVALEQSDQSVDKSFLRTRVTLSDGVYGKMNITEANARKAVFVTRMTTIDEIKTVIGQLQSIVDSVDNLNG